MIVKKWLVSMEGWANGRVLTVITSAAKIRPQSEALWWQSTVQKDQKLNWQQPITAVPGSQMKYDNRISSLI